MKKMFIPAQSINCCPDSNSAPGQRRAALFITCSPYFVSPKKRASCCMVLKFVKQLSVAPKVMCIYKKIMVGRVFLFLFSYYRFSCMRFYLQLRRCREQ